MENDEDSNVENIRAEVPYPSYICKTVAMVRQADYHFQEDYWRPFLVCSPFHCVMVVVSIHRNV